MADGDAELAARARTGDRAALEALYRRHVGRVWRYGWFRTRSREAAADVVQETFLRVAKSVGQFEGRSTFATWLFAVARSVAVQQARRDRPPRTSPADPPILHLVPAAAGPEDQLDAHDTRQAVRQAIAELPGGQRDATVLCELSGLSIREAAEALGWTESRVKVTLFRARRRLRNRLRQHAAPDEAASDKGEARSGRIEK
jgi:RNA polymerase sigma-70 factor (ECF subfamily)